MSHLFLSGEVSLRACSGALACCTGMAHCRAQRTLRGNKLQFFARNLTDVLNSTICSLCSFIHASLMSAFSFLARDACYIIKTCNEIRTGLYSSVAERQSCKLKVLGSIPSGGFSTWDLCARGANAHCLDCNALAGVSLPEWLRGWT